MYTWFKELNTPNKLTLLRIVFIPVYLVLLYFDTTLTNIIATFIFIAAGVTDWVDGYIARKYELVTDFGKILDPVADKILVASSMIALVDMNRVAAWIVIVILARDFAVGALRNMASSNGIIIAAGFSGKLKTVFQMVAIGHLTWSVPLFGLNIFMIGQILIYISLVLSLYSGWEYFKGFYKPAEQSE